MILIPPTPELAVLLEAFDARGGVIEFEFYEAETSTLDQSQHQKAAGLFLSNVATHYTEFYEVDEHDPLRRAGPRHSWDENQLTGKLISFAEFWGSELPSGECGIPDGFKTAFFMPPYKLSGGIALNQPLFENIGRYLFPYHLRNALTIFAWNTDCSSYFDAGREWWGTFFWTVSRPGDNAICVIAASTTD